MKPATTFRCLFAFCGMGAGALGFLGATATIGDRTARFVSIGGIDNDADACKDFTTLTNSPALCVDVATLTPERLREFAGHEAPDVVFVTAPCTGASKLISDRKASETKYKDLNRLSEVWVELMLATWAVPPKLVLYENVPNLVNATRGKAMLNRFKAKLRKAGYVMHDGFHDAGVIGGLAQRRRRWLMVARHSRVAPLLYQPTPKRVRGCGEVIGPMPMPGDPAAGPMHTLPKISWLNWVRLAMIPAGGDWRDLPGVVADGQQRREVFKRDEVCAWDRPCGTVGGPGSNGVVNIADDRVSPFALAPSLNRHDTKYAVGDWKKPAKTVTSATRPGSGSLAVNDPRVPRAFPGGYAITTSPAPSSGACAVVDARVPSDGEAWFRGCLGVIRWEDPSPTVTGSSAPSRGPSAVADPRALVPTVAPFDAAYGVLAWDAPSRTIAGGSDVGQGAYAVADPALRCAPRAGAYGVLSFEQAAKTITGSANIDNGPFAIADIRVPNARPVCVVPNIKKAPIGQVPVIVAEDGTWHRPLTTLELAALQGIPHRIHGKPLVLAGTSHTEWRRRIGNAVPPPAAKAIAERMLTNLLAAASGAFSLCGDGSVWVAPRVAGTKTKRAVRQLVSARDVARVERAALLGVAS
jgi:site-specific DNA-cytosine methylase